MATDQRPQQGPSAPASPRALGAGMTLAVVVGMMAYGGWWVDERLGTRPLFLLLGVLLGAVGGMLHLLRVLAPELLPYGKKPKPPESKPPESKQHEPNTRDGTP